MAPLRKRFSKQHLTVSRKIGRAIHDFNLIEDGDRILVGVSGGKDSLTLLKMLDTIRSYAPVKFSLHPVHVILDFLEDSGERADALIKILSEWDLPCETMEAPVKRESVDGTVNCFFCSWVRRRQLFHSAEKLKCNKVALGHHKDDIAQTVLLNLFYHGRKFTMMPTILMFGKIHIIRPLSYVDERDILRYVEKENLPILEGTCPYSSVSKRKIMAEIVERMQKETPHAKSNIIRSTIGPQWKY